MLAKKLAFTLVELSIVLVIIGLLVGGVLVGRTLIASAEISGTIKQKSQLDGAVNTFRLKYNFLPGDMPPDTAAQLGFFTFTGANAGKPAYGDGNSQINNSADMFGASSSVQREGLVFFQHLSDAKLVLITGDVISPTAGTATNRVTNGPAGYFPAAKFSRAYWGVFWGSPFNNQLANYFSLQTPLIGGGLSTGLSTTQAYAMDAKLDDGMPATGKLTTVFLPANADGSAEFPATSQWIASNPTAGYCTTGGVSATDPASTYSLNPSAGSVDIAACWLFLRFE